MDPSQRDDSHFVGYARVEFYENGGCIRLRRDAPELAAIEASITLVDLTMRRTLRRSVDHPLAADPLTWGRPRTAVK